MTGVSLDPQPSSLCSPARAFEQQDARFEAAFEVLKQAVANRAFPGASVAITQRGKLIAFRGFGRFTYDPASPEITSETIFDLASITKVLCTTTMAMILYERGVLDLEMPVSWVVPEILTGDPRREDVSIRMLLAHSSGLPAYEKLFLKASSKDDLLRAAFHAELVAEPGSRADYSDIGFIVLGVALERLADDTLDQFAQHEIFGPLGMIHTSFRPASSLRALIVPTADDNTFRHRLIQGEVQDENASVLEGVAGHAGLFATAGDVAIFANCMLSGGAPLLRGNTVDVFTRREPAPAGSSRALGWDTPSAPSQSGEYFSARSYGHLGYTGTSLWIDPERQLSITLLTNRTWPDCQNQAIKKVRPEFHDAVMNVMEASR
jgi:serine-type D-Ala-D-Ala carboxypeptidase